MNPISTEAVSAAILESGKLSQKRIDSIALSSDKGKLIADRAG